MPRLKEIIDREISRLPTLSKLRIYRQLYQGKAPVFLGVLEWSKAKLRMVEPALHDIFVDYGSENWLYEADGVVDLLLDFDVVSFDLFDTILFRKVDKPTDVFKLMEQELRLPGFARQRIEAEWTARQKKYRETGSYEVCLQEIYTAITMLAAVSQDEMITLELAIEAEQLIINPVMKDIVEKLQIAGKRLIAISDMYLDTVALKALLSGCGFLFTNEIYVSSEMGVSKSNGLLYSAVQQLETLRGKQIVHIGDNFYSDVYRGKGIIENCLQYIH